MLLCRMVLLKSGKGSCSFLLDACEARATLMSGKHGISPDGRVPRLLELDRWHPAQARPLRPTPQCRPDCMLTLERFIHSESDGIHPIIRVPLTHLLFETIHAFLDGKGRTDRQKSDNMAVMPSKSRQITTPPAGHLLQPAITCAPDRRLGSMAAVETGFNICGSPCQAAVLEGHQN